MAIGSANTLRRSEERIQGGHIISGTNLADFSDYQVFFKLPHDNHINHTETWFFMLNGLTSSAKPSWYRLFLPMAHLLEQPHILPCTAWKSGMQITRNVNSHTFGVSESSLTFQEKKIRTVLAMYHHQRGIATFFRHLSYTRYALPCRGGSMLLSPPFLPEPPKSHKDYNPVVFFVNL